MRLTETFTSMTDEIFKYILAGFGSILIAMSGGIGIMWKVIISRLEECEKDREELWKEIRRLEAREKERTENEAKN